MPFRIRRGTNISHWLSQSGKRGAERVAWLRRPDVERLAALGFDHLRIPVDEEQLWNEDGSPDAEAFGLLDEALDWCDACGLAAIVDLHILRSHHFNQGGKQLFTDPAALERFCQCWRDLSSRLKARAVDRVAYELLNEAVADDPEDWNRVATKAFETVRALEPERYIVLGSNRWNSTGTYDALRIPDDRRTILTFHFYEPFYLTHYRASWTKIKDYDGPVHYPGPGVLEGESRGDAPGLGKMCSRGLLARLLEKPLAARERTGLPLYCGEWGCIHLAPREDRMRWYGDVRQIFEDEGIAWATWDWKGGFGIESAGGKVDGLLAGILLG